MSNPFTIRDRDLKKGEPIADIITELWDFYLFMQSDEEVAKQYEQWKTFKILKRDNNENR